MSQAETQFLAADALLQFRKQLLRWYKKHARVLPWRSSGNPYHIWLSEIMLQQTRVDQARPYFERFVAAFPDVNTLAEAPLDDVLLNWEGLGYYSRARNLHKAAKAIASEHAGKVPDAYDAIRALPGIGPYTAAAVLSIAFGKAYGVLDGNVIRVLTRLTCNGNDVTKGKTRRHLQSLSDTLVSPDIPGDFNQAMMELGATVCTPKKPKCKACPVQDHCCAFAAGAVESFPFAKKKAPLPHYDIAVAIIRNKKNEYLIQRRPEDGMLGGLWQFPGGKQEEEEPLGTTCHREMMDEFGIDISVDQPIHTLSHAYTHFKITLHAFLCTLQTGVPASKNETPLQWVTLTQMDDFAFSRSNRRLIEQLLVHQQTPGLFD
ncbi:MAG: A/G-specific adenine glycosylase [Bacteroidota bacterium]